MALHDIYAVNILGTVLAGQVSGTVNTGSSVAGEHADGNIYPRTLSLISQKPGLEFTTKAIAAALDAVGPLGLAIATPFFSAYGQQIATSGTRTVGATHRQFLVNSGIIVPRTLSVDHQGDATLSYSAICVYDGTNDPVVINDSVSLPALTAGAGERFTLGKCKIGAYVIPLLQGFELDFGIDVGVEGAESAVWPTIAWIKGMAPQFTLKGIDITALAAANIPLVGLIATHANTTLYLKKRADGGTFVPDATLQHISFTASGLVTIDNSGGSTNTRQEISLTLKTRYDGTNAPIIIDTTAAIV